jgi:hypothetical protein
MRKGGGHAKGSHFERVVAKLIVKAFKKAKFGVVQRDCWRSVLSGGHLMSSGDVEMSAQMEGLFPYSVECKFRKKINWENFLLGNQKSEEVKWLAQAEEGARKRKNIEPLLVLKANGKKILVLTPEDSDCEGGLIYGPRYSYKVMHWKEFIKHAIYLAEERE